MKDLTNKSIKIENYEVILTSGDLINIIQHSVTRDDMESLRKEFKNDFNKLNTKIDTITEKLDIKIDTIAEKLDTKIDIVAGKLDSKIDCFRNELREDISKLEEKLSNNMKWGFGIIITILSVLHFLP